MTLFFFPLRVILVILLFMKTLNGEKENIKWRKILSSKSLMTYEYTRTPLIQRHSIFYGHDKMITTL